MTAESPATVADVLRRAAQIHAERGGCKGDYEDSDGHICAIGALRLVVARSSSLFGEAWRQLEARQPGSCLADWNDRPETTDADVEKLMLATADEIEFSS
jgi:hypothetical protein